LNLSVHDHPALKWRSGAAHRELDHLAVEEPLEIRLGGKRFTVTMRTPGHDEELVAGFLMTEGFVATRAEIGEIRQVRDRRGKPEPNIVDVVLAVPADALRKRLRRNFTMSSSCGLCGKTSIDALRRRLEPLRDATVVHPDLLLGLGPRMRGAQEIFATTGGLHAAALFRVPSNGTNAAGQPPDVIREDIGRHNAVDKVIGHALLAGMLPLGATLLMVSGRQSFEIVQKAAAAGVPILVGVSAPSSLAVELADSLGLTLVGFMRAGGFNVYCHAERVAAG
jgi:FdhD protein